MSQASISKFPVWLPVVMLIIIFILGVMTLSFFSFNQHTEVEAAWGTDSGLRNGITNWLSVILQALVFPPIATGIGVLILRQRPTQRMGWLLTLFGVVMGLNIFFLEWTVYTNFTRKPEVWWGVWIGWVANWSWVPLMALLLLMVGLFPNGQFLSLRWGAILKIALTVMVISLLLASSMEPMMTSAYGLSNPLIYTHPEFLYNFLFGIGVTSLPIVALLNFTAAGIRFWLSKGRERQQMKWLLVGGTIVAAQVTLGQLLWVLFDATFGEILVTLSPLGLLLGIGMALLRHQLYDIDIIIRRTLVYGLLSGVLALVYFGSIILVQNLVALFGGQTTTFATVISTLLIAALFAPFRRRSQHLIDRRFYRRKYDSEQILANFAKTARDEVELAVLTGELLRVVQETMQPRQMSLWLKDGNAERET